MNRLRLTRQAFDSIAPALHTALDEALSDRVEAWLRNEVCPVVVDLIQNRSFQLTTRWSLDHLAPGVSTSERRAVERVDCALVALAQALLNALEPPCEEDRPRLHESRSFSRSDFDLLRVIASRPWNDLVTSEEFFTAYGDLVLNTASGKSTSEQRLEHSQAFRLRELRVPLGDYVSRGMFARVEYWMTLANRLAIHFFCLGSAGTDRALRLSERVLACKCELEESVSFLRAACDQDGSARLREACTTLTLTYAAYAANHNLEWLGFPGGWSESSGPLIRSCIRRPGIDQQAIREPDGSLRIIESQPVSLCDPDTVRHIANALEDVAVLYELPDDPYDLIEWARNSARLVMVDRSPRQVFWDGTIIADTTWDNSETQWNLLWTLAKPPSRLVDQEMLPRPGRQRIGSRRSRLSEVLADCQDLDQLIQSQRGQGYRLELRPEEVILLQDDGTGRLGFVDAHHAASR